MKEGLVKMADDEQQKQEIRITSNSTASGKRLPSVRKLTNEDTIPSLIREELALRGWNQADLAREFDTFEGNISRWVKRRDPQVPDASSDESYRLLNGLIQFLRLRDEDDYAKIWFQTIKRKRLDL